MASTEAAAEVAVEDPVEDVPPVTEGKVPEKFFVVKSLTLQDLEQSVRNGIWATQSHNEQALNKAFEVIKKNRRHDWLVTDAL